MIDDQDRHSNEKSGAIEKKRSLASRWFGPFHAGSYRGSLVTLICSMVGIGFLTLPEMGKTNGLVPMIVLIVISSIVSAIANWQLAIGFRITHARSLTKIISEIIGKKPAIFCMIILILDIWVSIGAMYIFGARFSVNLLDGFNARPDWGKDTDKLTNYIILFLFVLSFLGSLARKASSLRYFSFISSTVSLLVGLVVVFETSIVREYYENKLKAQYPTFIIDERLFGAYCLSLFSTNNQYSVISVMSEFRNPTKRRLNKLILWGTVIPMAVYLLVSIGGYLSCGNRCKPVIINRVVPEDFDDIVMDVFKVLLIMCLIVGNVLRAQSNRTSIVDLYDQIHNQSDSRPSTPNPKRPPTIENRETNEPEIKRRSTEVSTEMKMGFYTINLPMQFINSLIPALTAIIVKDSLIKYVASCTGFFAPIFMIVYPCLITIRLYQSKRLKLSTVRYRIVWTYFILATLITYISLVVNLFVDDLENE